MVTRLVPPEPLAIASRIPITRHNVAYVFLPPILLYLYLCYLVRRPNTRKIRLALLPIIVPWLIALTFAFQWFPERTMAWNVPFSKSPRKHIMS